MKVGLNVGERFMVLSIMPKEGSFLTLRLIRTLVLKVGLSAQEIKDFEASEKGGVVKWNPKGSIPVDIEFDDVELEVIRKELRKMDAESKIPIEMFSIYEKFCL